LRNNKNAPTAAAPINIAGFGRKLVVGPAVGALSSPGIKLALTAASLVLNGLSGMIPKFCAAVTAFNIFGKTRSYTICDFWKCSSKFFSSLW